MKTLLEQFASANFLITTDSWFTAPDGRQYRAVWGKVAIHKDEETLGIKTNVRSSNWYAVIGEGDTRVIVAGCQVHYACMSQKRPFEGNVSELRMHELKTGEVERETLIYCAQ